MKKLLLILLGAILFVWGGIAAPVLWPTPEKMQFTPAVVFRPAAGAPVVLTAPADADCRYPLEMIVQLLDRNDTVRDSGDSGWEFTVGTPPALEPGAIPGQGYRLRIDADGVNLRASDREGLLNGLRTLRQLAEKRDGVMEFAGVAIEDAPVLPLRGIHLMLFGYTPANAEFLKRFIDLIGQLKYNALLLQIDGGAEYRRFAPHNAWPLETLKEINRYARERGIEIIPLLQLGGHSAWLFRFEDMKRFREVPAAEAERPLDWGDSLCPGRDDQLLPILYSLIDDLIDVFEPGSIHFAYDEITVDKKECPACLARPEKLEELYAGQVNALAKYCKAKNINPMIWGDQVLSHYYRKFVHFTDGGIDGEVFSDHLDRDIEIVNWYYSKDPDCYLVYNRYMTQKGFRNQSAAGMCTFDLNQKLTADAARQYGWGKAWLTSWYHLKDARPEAISAMMWRSIPYFAEMSWNTGRAAAETPLDRNRLNPARRAFDRAFPAEKIPADRQEPLTDGPVAAVTASGIVLKGKIPAETVAAVREMPIHRQVGTIHAIVNCVAPENAEALNGNDYEPCTLYPQVGTLELIYGNGEVCSIPLRYNLNIVEAGHRDELWGAEYIPTAAGPVQASIFANPHPGREVASLRWRAGNTPLTLTAVTLELPAVGTTPQKNSAPNSASGDHATPIAKNEMKNGNANE